MAQALAHLQRGIASGPMRRRSDHSRVLDVVARQARVPRVRAQEIVQVVRDCIDDELARDHTIAVWPLFVGHNDDHVARAFADHYPEASEAELAAVDVGENETVAEWLQVPLEVYDRYPLIGYMSLLVKVLDRLEIDESTDSRSADQVKDVFDAWLGTFKDGRRYRMSHVGLEKDFEDWLVVNLETLRKFGYAVALERRQPVLKGGRRPDLVCRFVETSERAATGDWLVIELKTGGGYVGAAEQLHDYVTAVETELATPGQRVLGLLITDGASPKTHLRVDEFGLQTLSLATLGYRQERARQER